MNKKLIHENLKLKRKIKRLDKIIDYLIFQIDEIGFCIYEGNYCKKMRNKYKINCTDCRKNNRFDKCVKYYLLHLKKF